MNYRAEPGSPVLITLQMEDGEPLPFVVDTGCRFSTLDRSFIPRLGQRVGTKTSNWAFYGKTNVNVYRTPKLYLGKTPLMMRDKIEVNDLQRYFGGIPIKGVLGIDCLRHYCVQFDFVAGKMRFLDGAQMNLSMLGKSFPLTDFFGAVSTQVDVMGMKQVSFRTDTGLCGVVDMILADRVFRRGMQRQHYVPADEWVGATNVFKSTTIISDGQTVTNWIRKGSALTSAGKHTDAALFSTAFFGGDAYTNVVFMGGSGQRWPAQNWLGLRFLSRHLVTFDFPNGTMYLRPENVSVASLGQTKKTAARRDKHGTKPSSPTRDD